MPKITLFYQQHRHVIGYHTNRQDRKQKSQKYQNDYIQYLARIPGRHTENMHRQDIAYTVLQLISMLSVVRNCSANSAVTSKRTNELNVMNRIVADETRYDLQVTEWDRQNLIRGRNQTSAEIQKKEFLRVASSLNEGQVYADTVNARLFPESICNNLKTILHSVTNVFYKTGQFISQYDPLKFPEVAAFPENHSPYAVNVSNKQAAIIINEGEKPRPIRLDRLYDESRRYLTKYYADYHSKYPPLKTLAEIILKDKIWEQFNLKINPNKASIMRFSITSYNGDERIHFPPVWENKTLTKWLFANIETELDEMHIAAGMYGIHDITRGPQKEYHVSDELKIRPIEFLQLVRNINFGHYAKEKLTDFFKNKDEHVKKYFIDFVGHIETSNLNNEAVKDVLTGVGILKEKDIRVCVFDIDGYFAFNAFVFRNKNKRVTLYLPGSNFKFISFCDDVAMRSWMKDICATKEHRDMIASHFSIADRQNGEGYYGINAWLNFIHEDDVTDTIAVKFVDVSPNYFFEYLFNQIRNKTLSDLDYLMKLDDGVRDDNWEQMIDAPSAIYNTNPSFLSLETRLKCVISAANYYGEEIEKCSEPKHNATDTITMVTLSNLLNFSNQEGYDFINIVIKNIETVNVKEFEFVPEKGIIKKQSFIQFARKSLMEFYEDYTSKYPELKTLAHFVLENTIRKRFNLNIDPDNVHFMHFDNVVYSGGEKVHYPPARENKTLTEWLFTNFDAETQDNLQDMDAMCGIYDSSVWKKEKYHSSDELKIKPTDFIRLVYDIDFYNYAKNKLSETFKDKDAHIKKYFIDFVNHLNVNKIRNESAKDVLSGVGIGKGRKIRTFLFDIDGYSASNAFIFRNEEGGVTLYFPGSDFKFISFRSNFEMQSWVTNACSTKEHRDMIASHFTMENRQDGILFYGIDAWLKFIDRDNDYYDKIAIRPKEIEPEHFFDFLFTQIKEKTFSDLDSLIKSDAEIRRDMWENMIDASNVIPNPVSPFLSLGMHLEHALDADTYEEKQKEWNKITSDTVNMVTMVTLSKVMNFRTTKGYKFIHAVSKDIENDNLEELITVSEMNNPPLLNKEKVSNPSSSHSGISRHNQRLRIFLPIGKMPVKYEYNAAQIGQIISQHTSMLLRKYPYDIFYGFNDNPNKPVPLYINIARATIKMHLNAAKGRLNMAYAKINDASYKNGIRQILSLLVGTSDERILTEAQSALKIMIDRARKFFHESEKKGFKRLGIISTKQTVDPSNPLLFHSAITDRGLLSTLPKGFTSKKDPLHRIYIMLDANPRIEANGFNIFDEKAYEFEEIIIHEISHVTSDSIDFFYSRIQPGSNIFEENIHKLSSSFNYALNSGELAKQSGFKPFMQMVYRYCGIDGEVDTQTALQMIKNDPMLKANIIMETADSFVFCVKELARMRLGDRVKRYDNDVPDDLINHYLGLIFMAMGDDYIE